MKKVHSLFFCLLPSLCAMELQTRREIEKAYFDFHIARLSGHVGKSEFSQSFNQFSLMCELYNAKDLTCSDKDDLFQQACDAGLVFHDRFEYLIQRFNKFSQVVFGGILHQD